ncbi:MAG: acyltransferase family protein [Prevotella sp.]|jgi:fucose 4-O-acetylase-like acetyltransferase|nr:acyltransferase family protein [Prevotella sp.]
MRKRDPFFDSLKFILICLVVFGHILEYSGIRDMLSFKVYSFIYTFHMPLFIFISGYFSKNITWDKLKKAFKTLLPAYLVFQTILSVPNMLDGSFRLFNFLTSPQGILWYILALLYWRIIFYFVAKIKLLNFPVVVISSVLMSLLIGLVNFPVFLSITKTITFLPYFALGYYCTGNIIEKIRGWNKSVSIAFLILAFLLVYTFTTSDFVLNLYGEFSYKYVFNGIAEGLWWRMAGIAAAVVLSCAVINIATDKLHRWGGRTLDIYLLHAPLVYIVYGGFLRKFEISPDLWVALIAFPVVMLLCIIMIRIKVFHYLVNPSLLFKQKNKSE